MFARIFLALSGLIWLPYGLYCFAAPGYLADAAGIVSTTATGNIELRAMYGGLQAGIGALAFAGALRPAWMRSVLFAGCFLFGGLAVTRSLAAIGTGEVSPYTAFGLVFEWTSTALAFWLLRANTAASTA
jgi:Domain of unknown function (DUF4345)